MARALALLLVLAACGGATTSESVWSERSPMTVARSEHPAVVVDGEIMVFGGFVESGLGRVGVTDTVEAYDPAEDTWRSLPPLPEPRHHSMAAVVDGRVFHIGGFSESGFDPVVDVWELTDGDWVQRTPLPSAVGAGAAVTLDGQIYVVGGMPDSPLLAYDPDADKWTELAAPDTFREHLAAVVYEGEIWAIGGRSQTEIHDSIEIYNAEFDQWRAGTLMEEPRSGFGAAVFGDRIYVAGGEVFDPDRALDSVEALDPQMGAFFLQGRLPVGLHGNPLVMVGGRLYVPGGSTQAAGVENAGDTFTLDPVDSRRP